MIHGTWVTATVNGTSKTSDEVDLGRVWEKVMMVIPTLNATTVGIKVAEKSGGTFQDLYITDTVSADTNQFLTTNGTGAVTVSAPLGGFQYIKVVVADTQSADRVVNCMGVRS